MATGYGRIQRSVDRTGVSLYPHPIPQLASRRCSWRNVPAGASLPMTITRGHLRQLGGLLLCAWALATEIRRRSFPYHHIIKLGDAPWLPRTPSASIGARVVSAANNGT